MVSFRDILNLYWRRRWVDLDWPCGTCQMMVGHPTYTMLVLIMVVQQSTFLQSLWLGLRDWITPKIQPISSIEPKQKWSTEDIDKPCLG